MHCGFLFSTAAAVALWFAGGGCGGCLLVGFPLQRKVFNKFLR